MIVLGCVTVRGNGSTCNRRQTGWSAADLERRWWFERHKTPFWGRSWDGNEEDEVKLMVVKTDWGLDEKRMRYELSKSDMTHRRRENYGAWMLHTKRRWWRSWGVDMTHKHSRLWPSKMQFCSSKRELFLYQFKGSNELRKEVAFSSLCGLPLSAIYGKLKHK